MTMGGLGISHVNFYVLPETPGQDGVAAINSPRKYTWTQFAEKKGEEKSEETHESFSIFVLNLYTRWVVQIYLIYFGKVSILRV